MDAPAVSLETIIGALYVENVRLRALVQQLAAEAQALKAQANGHEGPPAPTAPAEVPHG